MTSGNSTTNAESSSHPSSGKVVAVTGASGFIGSHVCQTLIQHGYHVKACVRQDTPDRTDHLRAMNNGRTGGDGRLDICMADMKIPGSYDGIFKGCSVIFHVAGNFGTDRSWRSTITVPGRPAPIDELIQSVSTMDSGGGVEKGGNENETVGPIELDGSSPLDSVGFVPSYDHAVYESYMTPLKLLLASVEQSATVRRIIYTSSGAAGGVVTSSHPTDEELDAAIRENAYGQAKRDCERLLYEFGSKTGGRVVCASSCPCIVLGPLLTVPLHDSVYQHRLGDMLAGRYTLQEDWWEIADVRDIATTQRLLAEVPDLINGTRIWNGWEPGWSIPRILNHLRAEFSDDIRIVTTTNDSANSTVEASSDHDDCDSDASSNNSSSSSSSFGVSEWDVHGTTTWSSPGCPLISLQLRSPRTTIVDTTQSLLDHSVLERGTSLSTKELCDYYTVAELDGCVEEMQYLKKQVLLATRRLKERREKS